MEAKIVKKSNFCHTAIYRFSPQMTASFANESNERKQQRKLECMNEKSKHSPKKKPNECGKKICLRFFPTRTGR